MDKAGDVLKTEQAGFLKEVVCYCSCFVYLPSCVVCYVILQLFWKLYHMVILSSYYTPYSNVLIFTGIDVDVLVCSSIYSYMQLYYIIIIEMAKQLLFEHCINLGSQP